MDRFPEKILIAREMSDDDTLFLVENEASLNDRHGEKVAIYKLIEIKTVNVNIELEQE